MFLCLFCVGVVGGCCMDERRLLEECYNISSQQILYDEPHFKVVPARFTSLDCVVLAGPYVILDRFNNRRVCYDVYVYKCEAPNASFERELMTLIIRHNRFARELRRILEVEKTLYHKRLSVIHSWYPVTLRDGTVRNKHIYIVKVSSVDEKELKKILSEYGRLLKR